MLPLTFHVKLNNYIAGGLINSDRSSEWVKWLKKELFSKKFRQDFTEGARHAEDCLFVRDSGRYDVAVFLLQTL